MLDVAFLRVVGRICSELRDLMLCAADRFLHCCAHSVAVVVINLSVCLYIRV